MKMLKAAGARRAALNSKWCSKLVADKNSITAGTDWWNVSTFFPVPLTARVMFIFLINLHCRCHQHLALEGKYVLLYLIRLIGTMLDEAVCLRMCAIGCECIACCNVCMRGFVCVCVCVCSLAAWWVFNLARWRAVGPANHSVCRSALSQGSTPSLTAPDRLIRETWHWALQHARARVTNTNTHTLTHIRILCGKDTDTLGKIHTHPWFFFF